jgi:hypothetical protein
MICTLLAVFVCEELLPLDILRDIEKKYGRGDPLCWPRDTLYPQTLAMTSLTCSGRSVGIVLSWSKGV